MTLQLLFAFSSWRKQTNKKPQNFCAIVDSCEAVFFLLSLVLHVLFSAFIYPVWLQRQRTQDVQNTFSAPDLFPTILPCPLCLGGWSVIQTRGSLDLSLPVGIGQQETSYGVRLAIYSCGPHQEQVSCVHNLCFLPSHWPFL